jgi:hypothetical protein
LGLISEVRFARTEGNGFFQTLTRLFIESATALGSLLKSAAPKDTIAVATSIAF